MLMLHFPSPSLPVFDGAREVGGADEIDEIEGGKAVGEDGAREVGGSGGEANGASVGEEHVKEKSLVFSVDFSLITTIDPSSVFSSYICCFCIKKHGIVSGLSLSRHTLIREASMFRPEFPPQEYRVVFLKEDGKSEDSVESAIEPYNSFNGRSPTTSAMLYTVFIILKVISLSIKQFTEHGISKCDCGVEDESFGGFSIDIEKIIT
ncbi:hypothetical protein L2E82_04550 [Cichorium intybus]|uniref:Uncharacterized protein n=1 Tax=Cichorium intybus TaxID=13427 RepID=A0ACB9H6N8_CICIN|nr:hypothetical protein L2E82_04550 [Cichorium intybus]